MGISEFVPPQHSALVVVDVQNDFCPGGSLAVPDGDEVVPALNRWIARFREYGRPIFFTRDWHPAMTAHFKEFGGLWPPHCVQGTSGADFHPELDVPESAIIISKGDAPDSDAYSGFDGHDEAGVPLEALLKHLGISSVYVGGLATDYCVKATVMDARRRQFDVKYLMNCSRAVNLKPDDERLAETEMESAGAHVLLG